MKPARLAEGTTVSRKKNNSSLAAAIQRRRRPFSFQPLWNDRPETRTIINFEKATSTNVHSIDVGLFAS